MDIILQLIGLAVVLLVGLLLYGRVASKGKILAIFHGGRTIYGMMLKEDLEEHCLWLGSEGSEDRERYAIEESKITLSRFPANLPWWLSIPVRTLEYVRGNPLPWDPEITHKSNISARSFRLITDEAMLKTSWRDVREALGLRTRGSRAGLFILMGLALVLGLTLFSLYLNAQTQSMVQALYDSLPKVDTGGLPK